jgi:hypothetical protein
MDRVPLLSTLGEKELEKRRVVETSTLAAVHRFSRRLGLMTASPLVSIVTAFRMMNPVGGSVYLAVEGLLLRAHAVSIGC